MDHTEAHPQAGQTIALALRAPDPAKVLYSGQRVRLVDWQDRVVGMKWQHWVNGPTALSRHYYRRIIRTETVANSSPDVALVETDAGKSYLVHADEVRPLD